ncbi:putative phage integrase [Shigella flexneri K-1770]|nr:putative phage integrase [Shigella flexneri K-1770]
MSRFEKTNRKSSPLGICVQGKLYQTRRNESANSKEDAV